jgi:CRP-like cAMP-binding protein
MLNHVGIDKWLRALRRRDGSLTEEEIAAAVGVFSETIDIGADQDAVREHSRQTRSHLLLEGWAFRYIMLADGRRQIVAIHLPGEFVDLHSFPLKVMDHSVGTFTPCRFALAPHERLRKLTESHPHVSRVLWLSTLIDAAILRHWLVGAGQRSTLEQIAHLFCEIYTRLSVTEDTEGTAFVFPLSQSELGDALGVSGVHTNRVLQELRARKLVAWQGRRVEILDLEGLQAVAEFDPVYLNLLDEVR